MEVRNKMIDSLCFNNEIADSYAQLCGVFHGSKVILNVAEISNNGEILDVELFVEIPSEALSRLKSRIFQSTKITREGDTRYIIRFELRLHIFFTVSFNFNPMNLDTLAKGSYGKEFNSGIGEYTEIRLFFYDEDLTFPEKVNWKIVDVRHLEEVTVYDEDSGKKEIRQINKVSPYLMPYEGWCCLTNKMVIPMYSWKYQRM